IYQCDKYAS
ncbi:putative transposase, partial [Chlamydia psittaci 02DC23]